MSTTGKIGLVVLALFAAVMAARVPAAAQQQPQISEARRAAIERCVQQAHQEAIAQGPGSGEQQQRYLIYSNCMVAAGFPAIAQDSRNTVLNARGVRIRHGPGT